MDDESLARAVAAGDVGAFAELYDRYVQRLYAWSAHMLGPSRAEDAIQEIFLRLWQNAAQFDPERGSFGAWFTAVARHHLLRELRRGALERRLEAGSEIVELLAAGGAGPEEIAGSRADAAGLAGALRRLPDEQRQVVVLAYFAGLSQSQMAERLGLPLGTVKKRVRLGLQKLRTAVQRSEAGGSGE